MCFHSFSLFYVIQICIFIAKSCTFQLDKRDIFAKVFLYFILLFSHYILFEQWEKIYKIKRTLASASIVDSFLFLSLTFRMKMVKNVNMQIMGFSKQNNCSIRIREIKEYHRNLFILISYDDYMVFRMAILFE